MPDMKGDNLNDLAALKTRMNHLFEDSVNRLDAGGDAPEQAEALWKPPADIYDTPDSIVLLVDVPGAPKDKLSVEVQGAALYINGERPQPDLAADARADRSERGYGPFQRVFYLPVDLGASQISASLEEGVLKVTVTKPSDKPGRINVQIE
jgi:HSP20 family protein